MYDLRMHPVVGISCRPAFRAQKPDTDDATWELAKATPCTR